MSLFLTLWPSRRHPLGRRIELTWRDLVDHWIAQPEPSHKKESVAGFSLATFEGDRRALANVERVFALMFDLDEGTATIEDAAKLWGLTRACLYTTFSSTPQHTKLRIVLALSRPANVEEHARLWAWGAQRLAKAGHKPDAAARGASRLFFTPSPPPRWP